MSPKRFGCRPATTAIGGGLLFLAACQHAPPAHLRLQSSPTRLAIRGASAPARGASRHDPAAHPPAIPLDTLIPLRLTTFDGSGQVAHPDVVVLPAGWRGGPARLAMAVTPYPYGNPADENPSLFTSTGGIVWTPPAGAKNPVERPDSGAYLSDPALVFDSATNELRMYYREVVDTVNVIRVVMTTDGVRWSTPRETVRVPGQDLLSPTVVRRADSVWMMWSVNAGEDGCASERAHVELRRSPDGLRWGEPTRVALRQRGSDPWHIDVKWIDRLHQYWALYNVKQPGSCLTKAVYFATSPDGLHWTTYDRPVLHRGAIPSFADIVYRSSFVYTPMDDMVTFYFSGARRDGKRYVWSGAEERRSRAELFADLERPRTRAGAPSARRSARQIAGRA